MVVELNNSPRPGPSLRRVLDALGDALAEVLAAPRGLGIEVTDVVILDPEDRPELQPGELALVVGARGRAAIPAVRLAGRCGVTAVAVKNETGTATALTDAAAGAGVALLGVPPDARWERVEGLARTVIELARGTAGGGRGGDAEAFGDLSALAQTVAALTGGAVTIEDTANRVLAYSRSSDDVDELRRLSILGRQGPERYLAMLREWGVYRRLRTGEGVVRVDERPDLGIRRRIAAGIHAGSHPLGTIWVQEGSRPLAEQAERALLGATRTAAPLLVRQRTRAAAGLPLRENLLASLLTGTLAADEVAEDVGADVTQRAAVAAFALGPGTAQAGPERRLDRAELVNLISVHAAAYRRSALVSVLGGRVYALLPDLPDHAQPGLAALAREVVVAAGGHLRLPVLAALGTVVPGLADVADSRHDADRVLDVMARDPARWRGEAATLADVRAEVLFAELLAMLAERPRLRDPGLVTLAEHDAGHAGMLVPSLLAYLEEFGDVRAAAARLHVHPNTLRYRVRRAAEISGADLGDYRQRLLALLQLRLPEWPL